MNSSNVGKKSYTAVTLKSVFHKSVVSPSSESLLEMHDLGPYATSRIQMWSGEGRVGWWKYVFSQKLLLIFSSLRLEFDSILLQVKTFTKKAFIWFLTLMSSKK